MDKIKILIITRKVEDIPIDAGNNFIKTMTDNDALFLNHIELYDMYGYKGMHDYIEKYIVQNEINTVIYGSTPTEFYFDISFFERLRQKHFLVMLTGDTEHYYEVRDQYYAQAIDLVIVNDFITLSKLQQIGIRSLPYFGYFDALRYHKIKNLSKDIDVSFIGPLSAKVGREGYVTHLLNNNINIKLFGSESQDGEVTTDRKIEIFNKSKINLNFSGLSEKTRITRKYKIHRRMKQIKGRIFEIAICGGFVLSEYAPDIENLFEIGKEIDFFHDKEELLEKVKYYLTHEEEREKIARKGYERAVKDYAVERAVPKLISTIDELRKKKIYKPSEIYLDEEFIRNYTTYRALLIIRFIKQLKWRFALEELKIILKYRKLDWYQILIFFKEEILDMFPIIKSILKSIRH